ncbi:MAG: glycosyltransferase family 8 protein [Lachnospiraceae bacterium]
MINLLFTLNEQDIEQLCVCIDSLLRYSDQTYVCYVLYAEIPIRQQEGLKTLYADNERIRFRFKYIDPRLFHAFPKVRNCPAVIYYKVLAATLLPADLGRILYLDTDVVAIRSPEEFYELDFKGNYYIACSHAQQFMNRLTSRRLGVKQGASYVNTGVMLMNLELLRKEQRLKDILKYVRITKVPFLIPDQDIITALYWDKIRFVDPRIYNLSDRVLLMNLRACGSVKKAMELVGESTVFIHYCGRNKPWKRDYLGLLGSFYHEVRQQRSSLQV